MPTAPRPVVVIDAGHSSTIPGARGYGAEEEVTLAIALRLRTLLEAEGIEVILTREGDRGVGANNRDDLMTRASYATPDRNLFVSIHANAHDRDDAHGIETLVFGRPLNQDVIATAIKENGGGDLGVAVTEDMIASANDIAGNILRESQLNYSLDLAATVQQHLIARTGARDRGIKQSPVLVLNQARTPAILVEVGFITHPEEGPRIGSSSYQDTLARALTAGIVSFLHGATVANR
jgi:N-acetylmuramoyl-L-alanine amidase